MIKKIYRLDEKQTKKVLRFGKPFFSYGIVSRKLEKNTKEFNRFSIIISKKSVENNIGRVFFRRKFFEIVKSNINIENNIGNDLVFFVKKQTKLDKNNIESIKSFEKDIKFLIYKNNL